MTDAPPLPPPLIGPDRSDSARGEEEHRFPCTACGADMRFDPPAGRMVCAHCGATAAMDGDDAPPPVLRELDFRAALDAQLPTAEIEETQTTECSNCGAELTLDSAEHATECPFCATPLVTGTGSNRRIKPRGVLPFVLDEAAAHAAMTDWLGRLWFAPNGLRRYASKGRRMEGVYVPYWTFDADTVSRYTGQRGDAYYVTRTVVRNGETKQVRDRRVRWSPVRGRVARVFDDVLVLASTTLPKAHTDALDPWDLSDLRPYQPAFLAGFRAQAYQIPLEAAYDTARQTMDRQLRRDVRFAIGGDEQRINSIDTTVSDVTFKHILLPVWMAAYKYRCQSYRFVVNGQTGRVRGERSWSMWKIAVAVVLGLIAAGVVGYFLAQQT